MTKRPHINVTSLQDNNPTEKGNVLKIVLKKTASNPSDLPWGIQTSEIVHHCNTFITFSNTGKKSDEK